MTRFLYVGIYFALLHIGNTNQNNPVIKINQGTLVGYIRKTWNGKTIFAFQSIPYAQPPVGNLRFKPPALSRKWNGVLNATINHPVCPQMDVIFHQFGIIGNEDCLYLNVYTPKISQTLLPVIIYIHGGSFTTEHANPSLYGPDILLDKDLVLVTINYRLGALGFLSLENDLLPGNNGLKDQSLGIKWVKDNIAHFGGNPNKLTIAGSSAGGASVYFHMVSPLTKDLLFAAISSSGIATATWALAKKGEARRNAIKLGGLLNCSSISDLILLECLSNVEVTDIVAQYINFMEFGGFPLVVFPPVLETGSDAFLTEPPIETLRLKKIANVPLMNGVMVDDGRSIAAAVYLDYKLIEQLNKDPQKNFPILYMIENSTSQKIEAISKFYFKKGQIDNSTVAELGDSLTDTYIYAPLRVASELHIQYTDKPAYFYMFGYKGSVSFSSTFSIEGSELAPVHYDDLIYIFSNNRFNNYTPSLEDLKMNDVMTTLWYNFANTGNPTPEINAEITTKWEPLENQNFRYYSIKNPNDLKMEKNFHDESFEFWKSLNVFPFFTKSNSDT